MGWSGEGSFRFEEESERCNGVFVARRYGGETPGNGFRGRILAGSGVELTYLDGTRTTLRIDSLAACRAQARPSPASAFIPISGWPSAPCHLTRDATCSRSTVARDISNLTSFLLRRRISAPRRHFPPLRFARHPPSAFRSLR